MSKLEDKIAETRALEADNVWGEHPDWEREGWRTDVANNDTNLGYWDWVCHKIEAHHQE